MTDSLLFIEQRYKRRIDVNSPFVLIGNNIDGYVNVDIVEFKNYDDLKRRLPKILINIKVLGEWTLSLFQYKKEYRIIKKYGYFKTPSNGKLLFKHDYMSFPIVDVIFSDSMIELLGMSVDVLANDNAKRFEDLERFGVGVERIVVEIC